MTVQELIEQLEQYDPYLKVVTLTNVGLCTHQIDSCFEDLNDNDENVIYIQEGQLC